MMIRDIIRGREGGGGWSVIHVDTALQRDDDRAAADIAMIKSIRRQWFPHQT